MDIIPCWSHYINPILPHSNVFCSTKKKQLEIVFPFDLHRNACKLFCHFSSLSARLSLSESAAQEIRQIRVFPELQTQKVRHNRRPESRLLDNSLALTYFKKFVPGGDMDPGRQRRNLTLYHLRYQS